MEEIKNFFTSRKNLVNLVFLLVLVFGLPIALKLAKDQQLLRSRAAVEPIVFAGDCVVEKNGKKVLVCTDVTLQLTSTLGSPSGASGSAAPSPSAGPQTSPSVSASPTASGSASQTPFNGPHNIPGKIEAEDFDNGGEGVAYHDTDSNKNSFQDYRLNELVDIKNAADKNTRDADNSRSVGRIRSGEWLEYTVNVANAGNYTLELRYYPDKATDSSLHIEFDGENKSGTISTSKQDKRWQTITKSGIPLTSGQHVMRIVFDRVSDDKSEGGYFNFVNFKLDLNSSFNPSKGILNSLLPNVYADDDENGENDPGGDEKNCNINKFSKKTWKKVDKQCLAEKGGKVQETWECQGKTHLRIVSDKSCAGSEKNGVTISYKVSENPNDLKNAQESPYTSEPKSHPFKFSDPKPGKKTVFVEFIGRDSKGREKRDRQSAAIDLIGPIPIISTISCQPSATGSGIILTLFGINFGSSSGSVKANSQTTAQVTSWADGQVLVSLDSSFTCGQTISVVLTRIDGETAAGLYGPSPISLGAKLFCRKSASAEITNVEMILVGDTYPKTASRVTITRDGLVKGLIDKLMPDKRYAVSFKAPKSVRRASNPFIFRGGTTQLILRKQETELDKKYYFNVLPIGDIFPDLGDGSINGFDKTTLNGQWGVASASAQAKSGDFNSDGVVNSVDWACMRYDFGENDDPEPSLNACPVAPACTGQLITGDPLPADLDQCPRYQCVEVSASPSATLLPTPSPSPSPSCIPKPACLETNPPTCQILPEPGTVWCDSSSSCGVNNCHGMDITCGIVPDNLACTKEYQGGDRCRQFTSCGIVDGSCGVIKNSLFDICKSCVESCFQRFPADNIKFFKCESKCGE